jgi:CBS domain-containing protein
MIPAGEPSLFVLRVRDLLTRPPVVTHPQASAVDVAKLLSDERVGSVVVVQDGRPVGIVTDRDLRRKVLAERRDGARTSAETIMSSPLITLPPTAFAFEALLEMTRRRIHHIVVVGDGRVVGVVSSGDLLLLQATHPVTLSREIARASSIEALAVLAPGVTALVRELLAGGGRVHDIAELVTELNDRIVIRVLELVQAELAAMAQEPPVSFAWLAFGSEGRREQTLRTDQDNGLVYADPPPALADPARAYFTALAGKTVTGLLTIGFPPCPGGAMASNPAWCQPLGVWDDYVRGWVAEPSPAHILAACMYFDLRLVTGAAALAAHLGDRIRTEAPAHPHFLGLMARDVVDRPLPVGFLGGVSVPRTGPHRGAVDIKGAGCIQLVGAARVHALELGLAETTTIVRIAAAGDRGLYSRDDVVEITDAYEHLLRLRLAHQLDRLHAGEAPDNYVDPERLSHRDRLLLRDALKTVGHVQRRLRERYATDFIPRP